MKREHISRVTRTAFREWLVGWTLREIRDLFEAHGFEHGWLPPEDLPRGERRTLVEEFYAFVDWSNEGDSERMLRAYEDVLFKMPDDAGKSREELLRYLGRDGYTLDGSQLVGKSARVGHDLRAIATLDVKHLDEHIRRIERALADDPASAIGSAKELIESTLKTILDSLGEVYGSADDIPKLLKKVQSGLELTPDDVDAAKRGADIIRRILSNLGAVAIGMAELRNLYGTGHGKGSAHKGLSIRHARLAVSSSAALCTFLLETLDARKKATQS